MTSDVTASITSFCKTYVSSTTAARKLNLRIWNRILTDTIFRLNEKNHQASCCQKLWDFSDVFSEAWKSIQKLTYLLDCLAYTYGFLLSCLGVQFVINARVRFFLLISPPCTKNTPVLRKRPTSGTPRFPESNVQTSFPGADKLWYNHMNHAIFRGSVTNKNMCVMKYFIHRGLNQSNHYQP